MDPVTAFGIAANVGQFIDLTIRVSQGLSEYVRSVKQAPKLSQELQQEAFLISLVLKELKSTLMAMKVPKITMGLTDALNDKVDEFSKIMIDMESRVMIKGNELIKRLKWPFTEKENEENLKRLETCKSTFTLALITLQSRQSQQTEEGIRNIEEGVRQMKYRTQEIHRIGIESAQNERLDDVIRTIDETGQKSALAYIYFDYKDFERQTFNHVTRTLLQQLLLQQILIPNEIEAAYDNFLTKKTEPAQDLFTEALQSSPASFTSTYLFLDALDECSERIIDHVLDLICRCKDSGMKIFCTSRPYLMERICNHLNDIIILSVDAHDEDVRNYLSVRLAMEWRHRRCSPQPVIDRLTKEAKGKFLLAKFQVEYILDKETPREAMNALCMLPADLESAYSEVLHRIKQAKGSETARKILSWLFRARRPLKMNELQEVLSIQTNPPDNELYPQYYEESDQLIYYCQGLVDFDAASEIVRFSHFTVEEFLKNKYLGKLLPPTDLAKVCLTYLTFDVFGEGPCTNKEEFNKRMQSYRFTDYALRYWGFYVRGEGEEDPEILETLSALFKCSQKCNAIRQHTLWIRRPWLDITPLLLLKLTWTPLHIIAYEGLSSIYKQFSSLYESGKELELGTMDSRDDQGETALHIAASRGHAEMVILLLHRGTDVAAKDYLGRTALHGAAVDGHADVVTLLLERNPDLIAAKDFSEKTALHLAAENGHADVVALLLDNMDHADVAAKDLSQMTVLHRAAVNGHKDVVALLLGHMDRADVAAKIKLGPWEGQTALHRAAGNGHADVVALLLGHMDEADVAAKDLSQKTALHRAAGKGHADVVALLLGHMDRADVAAKDFWQMTVLHRAAGNGHADVVALLLERNPDLIAAKDLSQMTALHRAAVNGHADVVALLQRWEKEHGNLND